MTTVESKVREVEVCVKKVAHKFSEEDLINNFLDSLNEYKKSLTDLKRELGLLNETIYNELFNKSAYYYELKKDMVGLRSSLLRLLGTLKRNNEIYTGLKSTIKIFSAEVDIFNENLDDLELKHILLPKNKKIHGILNSMR
jgi:hypothetical protein